MGVSRRSRVPERITRSDERFDSSQVERTGLGWILCGYGLQPGADGEPVVVPGAPGRSVGVTCLGRSAPKWPDGASEPPQTTS